MILNIIILLAGLALVVLGADWLVLGASGVARRAGVSEFVIGLTIVGMGTSAPEFVVSTIGALEGNADVAIGNVVGSNIFNTLLILGVTALILPIGITPENRRRDIPLNIVVTFLLILLGLKATLFGIGEDGLGRWDGILFLLLFAAYLFLCFRTGKPDEGPADEKPASIPKAILLIVAGLAGLIFGGHFFVDSATGVAHRLGVSDKFIAVTILAGGTSMPELATCIMAAVRKKGQLALGNILGSNIFNILLILGCSATIHPLSFSGMTPVDLAVLASSSLVTLMSVYVGKRNTIDRLDGTLFLLLEVAYLTYLLIRL